MYVYVRGGTGGRGGPTHVKVCGRRTTAGGVLRSDLALPFPLPVPVPFLDLRVLGRGREDGEFPRGLDMDMDMRGQMCTEPMSTDAYTLRLGSRHVGEKTWKGREKQSRRL